MDMQNAFKFFPEAYVGCIQFLPRFTVGLTILLQFACGFETDSYQRCTEFLYIVGPNCTSKGIFQLR